eukprot:CAMPEP_0176394578 /NCGR_PEP_ID=MMETSP0126-20121128/42692_1 /TAXON_ID=141414 ORGANISM="Strombidinopsis acuminatum, Strain SPMC142" /NCGR_SAMPLE_ID=MMETSP0126 /ASSEMBLY_ACC=CAM_ASM_000229 /LENGTH=56 /DNA_ID=CAMNT_0017766883 /DNA_START=271 /DNA_END=441 /DNA_ORIENTATION=+
MYRQKAEVEVAKAAPADGGKKAFVKAKDPDYMGEFKQLVDGRFGRPAMDTKSKKGK